MSNKHKDIGAFVISLDFELMWGMFDKVTEEDYDDSLRGVHMAIPRLLSLFKEYDIHATWATVGMLTAYHTAELVELTPLFNERPIYLRPELSAYEHFHKFKEQIDSAPDIYLAPELVEMIKDTPHQEIASHTFSHYYCLEEKKEGQDETETFTADALAIQKAFDRFNVKPTSMVFPRNQWTNEALHVLKRLGYVAYRGTEDHFLYRARTDEDQTNLIIRSLRLIDSYFNLSGHHTYKLSQVNDSVAELKNVPASRFLRPYSKLLAPLQSLKLKRIKNSMTRAAKRGEIYHLWWHPHNFGTNQAQNFKILEAILKHYQYLNKRYFWESANMSEVAKPTPLTEPDEPKS